MTADRYDTPGQGYQWGQNENQKLASDWDDNRFNEEEAAENDRRGIDNPDLNRDRNSSLDQDRNFDTEDDENEDENDDFLTNGLDDDDDDDDSLTDDEDFDEDPEETKRNQRRTGTDTNPDNDRR